MSQGLELFNAAGQKIFSTEDVTLFLFSSTTYPVSQGQITYSIGQERFVIPQLVLNPANINTPVSVWGFRTANIDVVSSGVINLSQQGFVVNGIVPPDTTYNTITVDALVS